MGREALIAAVCCLMISGTRGVNNLVLKDQLGAESASRLYRQSTGLVYASSAPYGAYSFHIPSINAPPGASSKIIPVKESLSLQHATGNGYLKDSYGNRFVEALQSMKALPFKPFPQQYVQLQELPSHFSQPLAAAAPVGYQQALQQYKQPQVIVGSHYRLPFQSAAPTPLNQHVSFVHPGVYADNIKHLSPASISYGPHFGSVVHLPVQSAVPTRESHTSGISSQDSSQSLSEYKEHRSSPQQSSGHRAVHIETQPYERYHHLPGEHKFQRLQQAPQESYNEESAPSPPARKVKDKVTTQQLVSAITETPIPTVVNGKKTVVNVKTRPPLPLLDINLLEPLTFANPLVPQVQHFLPRINEATYHKLPELDKHEDKKYQKEIVIQKTKTYDNGMIKGKSKKSRNKHKSPKIEHTYHDDYIPAATARPQVTVTKVLDDAPEIVYEINSPNYKETIKEKAVSYNKETNSEPVHYNYGTQTHKEPVHYSYMHTSKEPVHIKEVRYEGKGESPKHRVYNFKPEDHNRESERSKTQSENEPEDSGESSERSEDDTPQRSHHREYKQHHSLRQEAPKDSHHYVPEHREQEYHRPSSDSHHNVHYSDHHRPGTDSHHNVHHSDHHTPRSDSHHNGHEHHNKPSSDGPRHHEYHKPSSGGHHNTQHREQEYHHNPQNVQRANKPIEYESVDVVPFQYEEDITSSLAAPIKVDPNQHVQHGHSESPQQPQSSPSPQQHPRTTHSPQHYSQSDSKPHHDHDAPSTYVKEKTKQVYIQEETPEEDDTEKLMRAMFGKEEDKEQDFENAYKNAAFGFPAYEKINADVEKDIYNPASYGVSQEHTVYDIDHAPFEQYQKYGDDFPKEVRLGYQDHRDKMKEDYVLDYSVSKPESLADRFQNKANYYKLYKNQRPEKYVAHDDKKEQKSAKLTAIPYSYYPVIGDNMKQFFSQFKAAPYVVEYDYSKGVPAKPKDNSAHASHPFQRYKMTTHFVEPQFQYGFEPIAIPRLLDSELAAMASNNSPESEKPGTRKKIYKENFYIKKMSMSDASPNS